MKRQTEIQQQLTALTEVQWQEWEGGLQVLEINNDHAKATISLIGAQVLSFQPHGQQPVLWLSETANLQPGKSIRGGIPVCWPWFADHPEHAEFPAHGFVRDRLWTLDNVIQQDGGETRLCLSFPQHDHSDITQYWPDSFALTLTVTVGASLTLELGMQNTGDQIVKITTALHSYFQVGNAAEVFVDGVEGMRYFDKVTGKYAVDSSVVKPDQFIDRVYLDTTEEAVINDPVLQRQIHIQKSGSLSTVIWNPWSKRAQAMADFDNEGYRNMVCVETANALENALVLQPGETHVMGLEIGVTRFKVY